MFNRYFKTQDLYSPIYKTINNGCSSIISADNETLFIEIALSGDPLEDWEEISEEEYLANMPEPETEIQIMSTDQAQRLLQLEKDYGMSLEVEQKAEALTVLCMDLALPEPEPFGEWRPGEQVTPGVVRTYKGITYVVREGKGHPTLANWTPDITPALWEVINLEDEGTLNDPIPALLNMMYYKDKYYSENSKIYRCTRDSEIPLAYLPSQLIGHYFELVK